MARTIFRHSGTLGDFKEAAAEYFRRTSEGRVGPQAEITELGEGFFSFILSPIPDEGSDNSDQSVAGP
jgi:hypothetical protein